MGFFLQIGSTEPRSSTQMSLDSDTLLKEFVGYFAYLNLLYFPITFLKIPLTILNETCSGGIGEIFDVVSFLDLLYFSFSMVVCRNKPTKGLSIN